MALLIAVSTYAMRWFAGAHFWLQKVSERSATKVGQLVPLLLCFPCFKAHQFLFKIIYALNQRKLLRLSVESARLSGHDGVIHFDDLALKQGSVAQTYCRLRYIAGCLDSINGALDRDKINHLIRLSALRAKAERILPSA